MNTLEFAIWRPDLFEEGFAQLNSGAAFDRIIFHAHQEFEYNVFQHFEALVDYSDIHDVPFYVVISTSKFVKPLHDAEATRYRNVVIQHWGTFLLTDTIFHRRHIPESVPEPFRFPFISMNNKPHAHRCLMLDTLAKYSLIDRGAVSWRDEQYRSESHTAFRYPFKHWSPVTKMLTEADTAFNHLRLPSEYNQSFVQLVVESSPRVSIASEKTWMPIINKKLFVVFGAQHHHAMLQDYGFLLYDEIFDYSFDKEPDQETRAEIIVHDLIRIVNTPLLEQHQIYNLMVPKLEYNYNLAMTLAKDRTQIPEIIQELRQDPDNIHVPRLITDFIYEAF